MPLSGRIPLILLISSVLLSACIDMTEIQMEAPQGRWACPSPIPQAYGEDGPVKDEYACNCVLDPNTGLETCETCREYYEIWEQEYGHLGGPPFPAPTPYGFTGDTFFFGQRVEIGPLHVVISAEAGPMVELDVPDEQQLQQYLITFEWHNPTDEVTFSYARQLVLRSITQPDGRIRTDGWQVTRNALESIGEETLSTTIPTDDSVTTIPILAPPGEPKTIELVFPQGLPQTPETAVTPTPNTALQSEDPTIFTLQWLNSEMDFYGAPPCGDAGTLTDWESGVAPPVVAAPEGASRVVQLALQQVGKPYVWGAEGPNTFDCSGLMQWVYSQIGIAITRTTYTQWPELRPVIQAEIQPGDLAFMDTNEPMTGEITHVGMLADVDNDGTWDYIHAASPRLGVRVDYDVFRSSYYAPRFLGFRTVR